MILGIYLLISGCARVASMVAVFVGPMGLLNILIGFNPYPAFIKPLSAAYIPLNMTTLGLCIRYGKKY